MKKDFEIIENPSMKKAIKILLKKNLRPATIEEIWKLRKAGKIPINGYDTGTLWFDGEFTKATKLHLQNIEEIYREEGRLLYLGDYDYFGLGGYDDLNGSGRFVGVRDPKW